ncbi:uncharacterized protein [Physcomitrium patens]|uniref:uncharacterized protein isoform X1 n=1 Tax=Physcomitrium patens TaxID=3218 RepID=UPI003CCD6A97
MGRLYLIQLDGRIYSCRNCRSHLAQCDELVSKSFHCRHGKAYLFNTVKWLLRRARNTKRASLFLSEPRWSMATAAIHFQSAMEMMNNPSLCLPPRSTALVWRVPSKVLVGPILQPQNPALAPLQPHRFRFYGFFLFLFIFIFTLFVKANNPFRRHDLAQTGGKEKEKENC